MQKTEKQNTLFNLAERLSRADIVFFTMPFLFVLLVIGTIAQAQMGLYDAHQKYFSAFVFWWGWVPFPAGYTICLIITGNLLLKFLFFSEWSWRKAGIILSHLGALVLLIGGLLTALLAQEGFMIIPEGQQTPYIYDYHNRELMIFKDDALEYRIPFKDLTKDADLPLGIKVLETCANCKIEKREDIAQSFAEGLEPYALAQFMALIPTPKNKDDEANLTGLSFKIKGLGEAIDGLYIAFEAMPKPIEFDYNDSNYKIIFGKEQRRLPFEVALNDFIKEDYPGMSMARAYSSDVSVIDGDIEWDALIEMNAPLRYKGYTFYQSSFDQTQNSETTILSVVENKGRIFPYLGTFILAFGLLLHIMITFKRRGAA